MDDILTTVDYTFKEYVRHRTYWTLSPRSLHASIVFSRRGKVSDEGLVQLEETSRLPECPIVVEAFLAEVYESRKEYDDAIRVWSGLLVDPASRDFHPRANRKIIQLKEKLGAAH